MQLLRHRQIAALMNVYVMQENKAAGMKRPRPPTADGGGFEPLAVRFRGAYRADHAHARRCRAGNPGGKVGGLIQTTVCAEGGDSGGPLYDGSKAIGLTSGGSGNCSTGGTTFFQPVREAVNAYGVTML